jgi:hypothetical protein
VKEATMKVKLTSLEPSDAQINAISDSQDRGETDIPLLWVAAHDAAPDDATKALEGYLKRVHKVLRELRVRGVHLAPENDDDLGSLGQMVREAWVDREELRATEAGAALIRQAEDRDDG